MRDLLFLFVDHFEPRAPEPIETWAREYPGVAAHFTDADGHPPQHTWFYDDEDPHVLDALSKLCRLRLGEIEVHLHHSHDTPDGLREKIEARKIAYAKHGALITSGETAQSTFGFIHGKWSLDNSRGDEHCGVNNEIALLRDAGCYADFTFPAWGPMQPTKCNAIYYATDDERRPKSYDTGVDVQAGMKSSGDLLIFQGPGRLSGLPGNIARFTPLVWIADWLWGTCAVNDRLLPTPSRIDQWVRTHVHVKGRPEWTFVKVHTHGARPQNYQRYFRESAGQLHQYLAGRYNDGSEWRLHYVTAREAYNIVKAAEAGLSGNPNTYRDFLIAPYRNRH